MSINYICDFCFEKCQEQVSKRWECIQGDLGLEVIVLRGSKPAYDMHMCSNCITKMFWDFINRDKENPISKFRDELILKTGDYLKLEKELKAKLHETEARIKQLQEQQETLDLRKTNLDIRETKIVVGEVGVAKWENAVRQAEARGFQRAIDEKYDPDYVSAIEENQMKRMRT